jgi:hypothetical protein
MSKRFGCSRGRKKGQSLADARDEPTVIHHAQFLDGSSQQKFHVLVIIGLSIRLQLLPNLSHRRIKTNPQAMVVLY